MSVVLQRCSWLSKTCSDSKSRVSEVKNSRNIFTLFSPQSKGPFSKTVRETCHLIRVRLKNNLYLDPSTIGFDGEVFYSLWQEMEPPQLVVLDCGSNLDNLGINPYVRTTVLNDTVVQICSYKYRASKNCLKSNKVYKVPQTTHDVYYV